MNGRVLLWRVHSWLGISLGILLGIIALTGAMMAFQDEMMEMWSGAVVTAPLRDTPPLSPDALVSRAERQAGVPVLSLTYPVGNGRTPNVRFARGWDDPSFGARSYMDPVSGRLLGDLRGQAFFDVLLDIHRFMALPGAAQPVGRVITGVATLSLIFFAVSGLYLRWPRHPLRWRSWFDIDMRRKGRMALRMIHICVGPVFVILYLYSALTGLWWAFDWYQRGATYILTGQSAPHGPAGRTIAHIQAARPIAPAWQHFQSAMAGRDHGRVIIIVPRNDAPILFLVGVQGAWNANAVDQYRFDARDGHPIGVRRAADQPLAQKIVLDMRQLHKGGIAGVPGRIAVMASALSLVLLAATGAMMYRARRRKRPTKRATVPIV